MGCPSSGCSLRRTGCWSGRIVPRRVHIARRPTSADLSMRLSGKVALISGGARGMGAVEARLFATEKAKVVIGDVLDAEGHAVEAEIKKSGGEAVYVHLDVTSEADWKKAVETAVSRFGKLDVLVNNAGV